MFNGRSRSLDATKLQREVEILSIKLLRANAELRMKTIYASRLEMLVHERCAMIDALHGRIDQLRQQNQKLDAEAEHLAQMVAAAASQCNEVIE
jgi:hypothetical protein